MTTPAIEWERMATQLNDVESIRFANRLIQFQREWLDNQAAQLEQIQRMLSEQEQKFAQDETGPVQPQ